MKMPCALVVSAAITIATLGCADNSSRSESDSAAAEAEAAWAATAASAEAAADTAAAEADAVAAAVERATTARNDEDGVSCNVPNNEDSEMFGLILNMNSLLCAKVVKVCALKLPDSMEITCIEYRGGSATKTYSINTKTAIAFEQ